MLSISYDMIQQKIVNKKTNTEDELEKFINSFLLKDIAFENKKEISLFIVKYSNSLSSKSISYIVNKYCKKRNIEMLIEYYNNIFEHFDMLLPKNLEDFEMKSEDNILRDLVSIILIETLEISIYCF